MTPAEPAIETSDRLGADDVAAVTALAERAEADDGVGPLSEHARLHLARGGGPDLVARTPQGRVAGYAHLDGTDAELVVDPEQRRQGYGRALVAELERNVDRPSRPTGAVPDAERPAGLGPRQPARRRSGSRRPWASSRCGSCGRCSVR